MNFYRKKTNIYVSMPILPTKPSHQPIIGDVGVGISPRQVELLLKALAVDEGKVAQRKAFGIKNLQNSLNSGLKSFK